MSALLALDLGTTTGWALATNGRVVVCGSQSFTPRRFDGGGMRYLRFRRWLEEMLGSGPNPAVGEVCFEEVRRHLGVDAAHAYGGFLAVLTALCEERGIPYQGVPVQAIKKFATGKGNAAKADMIAAARRLGFDPVDDNHADAVLLAQFVLAQSEEAKA